MFPIRPNYYPQENSGLCVVKRKGESNDELIRRFRKMYSKSGIAKEFRDRMFYEKPSDKKRRKKMQSIRNIEREKEKIEKNRLKLKKLKAKHAKKRAKAERVKARQNDRSN